MDDVELLGRYAQEKDQQAFSTLVERHEGWVYAAARRQVRDEHAAEDVAQAVFAMLSRRAGKLKGYCYLGGWLFRALSYCVDEVQRERVRRRRREAEAARLRSEVTSMEADWEEIAPELEAAVGKLGKADRDVVLLRFYEQRPLVEVGRALGISEEAARKRVERAVGKLREKLSGKGVEVEAGSLGAMVLAHAVEGGGGMEGGAAGLVEKVMAGIGGGGGNGTAGLIAKGAEKMMVMAKVKVAAVIVATGLMLVGVGAVLHSQEATVATATTTTAPVAQRQSGSERVAPATEPSNPLGFLIAKNEQARHRIKSASYVVAYEHHFSRDSGKPPVGVEGYHAPLEKQGTVQIIQEGNRRYTDLTEHVRFADGEPDSDAKHRTVVDETYSAAWTEGTLVAYLWDHQPGGAIAEQAELLLRGMSGPDVMKYGFGTGRMNLRALWELNPDAKSWQVQEQKQPDGKTVYKVDVFRATAGGTPQHVSTYIVDPNRGFMITDAVVYDATGKVETKRKVTVIQVDGADVWFPQQIEQESDGATTKCVVKEVKVNVPVEDEDERFTIAALRIPNGNRVMRIMRDGKVEQDVYQDGALIPIDVFEDQQGGQ